MLQIPSHVAQVIYNKINALKDLIGTLPDGAQKDAVVASEADLHRTMHEGFLAVGGVYISPSDHAALATTNAPTVIVLSNDTGTKGQP